MSYSIVSALALIINLIINREAIGYFPVLSKGKESDERATIRYSHFLMAATLYFASDIAWGLLYENHGSDSIFPILYIDCVLYFLFMFITMLTWIRYIVEYLDKRRHRSKALLYAVWTMFTLALVQLLINRFYPFIFSFNEKHEYIPEPGRHIAFILQIALYMVTSTYMLHNARRSAGTERIRYFAVGLTCLVMELFLILQILDPKYPFYAMGLMIGICLIHTYVEADEKKEKEIYDNIATSLANDYDAMYYINIESGEYREFSASEEYRSLDVPVTGRDFFAETQVNAMVYAHPDDRNFAASMYSREAMLKNLEDRRSYSYKYRIMVGGQPRYFRFTVMRANDDRHLVLYEKDIDDEVTAETMRRESQKKHITFSRIAESLASNYDEIYYVDAKNSSFVSYEFNNIYGQLEIQKSGDDFYAESLSEIPNLVHKNDCDMVREFIDRDHLISALKNSKERSIDYRVMINGRSHYFRMTVRKTADASHFIIGVENIDAEVRKEKQQLKALNTEKELARRDELTGVKNKTAYMELEKSVQSNIDGGEDYYPFAIVVCDANDLKKINDNDGHVAGDEYIKGSAMLLCEIFDHSPVFRVGGDEFVIFLRGNDYTNRAQLMKRLRDQVCENQAASSGPVLASGMSEFISGSDTTVSDVFNRADRQMYDDKQRLKALGAGV